MKKVLSVLLVLTTLLGLFSLCGVAASAASTSAYDILNTSKYAKVYTLSTSGRTTPYTSKYLSTRGSVTYGRSSSAYIDNRADELYLCDVGVTNGKYWAYVSYPIDSRRAYAYIPLSAITSNNGSHAKTQSSGKFYCSYRKGYSTSSSYYVAKGDTVYLIATSGSQYQILYPISGGKWRIGWCSASNYNTYCGTKTTAPSVTPNNNTSGLVDVTSYFAGKKIILQSVQNGKYMCADANYLYTPVMCNRSSTTNWTSFYVSSMTYDGWVGIKANTNSRYLRAANDRTDTPIRSTSSSLQSWECFRIYMKGSDFYIKSQSNGKFLCVRIDKSGAPVQAYANAASTWERFRIIISGQQYISAAELIGTAVANNLSAKSSAYKALCSINNDYARRLSSSQKSGTSVFMFEGVGNNSSSSKRLNAMCVVVKNGDIVYLNRNSSTIPDYPFNPYKNEGTPMPTIKSGIYSFTTVNHHGKYAALNVYGAKVVRFRSASSFYSSTSSAINVHRRDSDSIAPASSYWVNSAGCLLIGKSGTGYNSEYASFIKAVGIVGSGAYGNSKYSYYRTGTIVVDRSFAKGYLAGVGYYSSAIRAIG